MIRLDVSERTVVVWCDECRDWSEITTSREAANRVSIDHEMLVHPESKLRRVARHGRNHYARNAREPNLPSAS